MKILRLTIQFASFLMLCTNGIHAQIAQKNNQILIGSIDSVNSKILNEKRKIWIYVPASANSEVYAKQKYPVIYLLDGDSNFPPLVGMLKYLNDSYSLPEMIVVGIPNTDRTRDLTPTHMDSWHVTNLVLDNDFCKTSGGGENFISFIEKELIPHIDSVYPTTPYRIIIGHSFGGLTVMNTFIHHTGLFRAYVAIDPAMSWDNQKLLKETNQALETNTYAGISLFLSIANTMVPGLDTISVKQDTTRRTEYIRSNLELRDNFARNKQNQLDFAWRYYGNDNHGSVPLITMYDALRWLFNYYHMDVFNEDYKNIEPLFSNVSKHLGYHVKPPGIMVNFLANAFLSLKEYDAAKYLLDLNASSYPDSWAVYNNIGNYYRDRADTSKAIDYYKKALSIKELPVVRQKLEKFQKKF